MQKVCTVQGAIVTVSSDGDINAVLERAGVRNDEWLLRTHPDTPEGHQQALQDVLGEIEIRSQSGGLVERFF